MFFFYSFSDFHLNRLQRASINAGIALCGYTFSEHLTFTGHLLQGLVYLLDFHLCIQPLAAGLCAARLSPF